MSSITTNLPAQLAATLAQSAEDFIWLDSAGALHPKRDQFSWLAWQHKESATGSIFLAADQVKLRKLQHKSSASKPLFGWIDYVGKFHFSLFDYVACWDHSAQNWTSSLATTEALRQINSHFSHQKSSSNTSSHSKKQAFYSALPFQATLEAECSDQDYLNAIQKAKNYIAAGDIYQVNLARKWTAPWHASYDSFELYQRWRKLAKAPQSAFIRLNNQTILSASPETYVNLEQNNKITCYPIKGTIRADKNQQVDATLRTELQQSAKEQAELVMITDLLRNDLGKVAQPKSVQVEELCNLESFGHLHHLVSTISAKLAAPFDAITLLEHLHPGGSITGAPKKRAMEIIAELEYFSRDVYCGGIGLLSQNQLRLSIAIRTATITATKLQYFAGSGIVADSVPSQELQETKLKASAFEQTLASLRSN